MSYHVALIATAALTAAVSSCRPAPCGLEACDIRGAACQRRTAEAVSCLRGTPPATAPIPTTVVPYGEYLATAQANLPPTPSADEQRLARARVLLGLEPAGLGVAEAVQIQASNVGAQYDARTKSVTIVDRGERLDSIESVATLAHEYAHALQDQRFDLEAFSAAHARGFDGALALGALTEGEATFVGNLAALGLFGASLDAEGWHNLERQFQLYERLSDQHDRTPVLLAWRRFRYPFGLQLVQRAYETGGWTAVDALYDQPATSSAQVLARDSTTPAGDLPPEDLTGEAVPLIDGAQLVLSTTLGGWMLESLLRRLGVAEELAHAFPGCRLGYEAPFVEPCDDGSAPPLTDLQIARRLRGDAYTVLVAPNDAVVVAWRMRFADPSIPPQLARWLAERRYIAWSTATDVTIVATDDPALTPKLSPSLAFGPAMSPPTSTPATLPVGCVLSLPSDSMAERPGVRQ